MSLTEGNAGTKDFTFTVTLSNPSDSAVTVEVDTANGTATTADGDYVAIVDQVLTFAAGETSKTVTVVVNGDVKVEGDETFTDNRSKPRVSTIGDG